MRSGKVLPGRMASLMLALAISLLLGALCGCVGEAPATAPASEQSSSVDTVALDKQAIRDGIDKDLQVLKNPTPQDLEGLVSPENCEMASHLLRCFSYEIGAIDIAQDKATATVCITCLDVSDVVNKSIASLSAGDELNKNAQMYDSTDEEDHKKFARHVFEKIYEQIDVTTATKTYEVALHLTRDAKTNTWSANKTDVVALIDGLFAV